MAVGTVAMLYRWAGYCTVIPPTTCFLNLCWGAFLHYLMCTHAPVSEVVDPNLTWHWDGTCPRDGSKYVHPHLLILILFSVFVLKPIDRCTHAHLMCPTPATPTPAWPEHRACPRDGFKVGSSLFPHLIFLFQLLYWKPLIDVYAPTCINPTRPQPGLAWAYVKCARDEIKVSTFSFSHYLSLSVVVLKPIDRSCTHDPDLAWPGCRTCMRDGLKVGHFFHSSYFFFSLLSMLKNRCIHVYIRHI